MGLADYLSRAFNRTKASFSSDKEKWMDYLMNYELKGYFGREVPEEERAKMRGKLEEIVDKKVQNHEKDLGGLLRKATSKGTMGLALANDIYGYVSSTTPLNYISYGTLAFFGIKTLAEIPALYRYVKRSKDFYGALKFLAMKPVRYLLPVIGPMLEAGAFERMVRKGIIKETKYQFIKELGEYKRSKDAIKEKMKRPIRDIIEFPQEEEQRRAA